MKQIHLGMLLPFLALTGCSLIPGQYMNSYSLTPTVNANGKAITPTIVPINAQLIQQQHRQADISAQLAIKNYVPPKGFTADFSHYNYRIGVGDIIGINVWNYLNLTNPLQAEVSSSNSPNSNSQQMTTTVDSNGDIYYPYIGYVHVENKTTDEVRQLLTTKLLSLIKNPQVNVSVVAYNSQHVTVTGAVVKPSDLPISNVPLTVLDAVTNAAPIQCGVYTVSGEMPSCADINDITVEQNGVITKVNLNTLKAPTGASTNWILADNAIVNVPNNNLNTIFVLGSVNAAGPFYMVDGKMSLQQALGNARGVADLSDPEYTYVIRNFHNNPQIYSLDASSVDSYNLASEFMLEPQDVVFVSTSKLATFGEVISQINQPLTTAVYVNSLIKN